MDERSKNRLHSIGARFGTRILEAEAARASDPSSFLVAFHEAKERVLLPVFNELAHEIELQGHKTAIESDDPNPERPGVTLRLFLTARRPGGHRVSFQVIDRGKGLQVLALLEATALVTDIARYTPQELSRDVVEQIVVDAIEHIFSCVAELC